MNEIEKNLTDRRLSLSARGLLALVVSMPDDWKYSWSGLMGFVSDTTEATKARNELQSAGIDISRVPPRPRVSTTVSLYPEKEKDVVARGGAGGRARVREDVPYPNTTEEVISAASDRAYLMSIQEAANFLAHYGAPGWVDKNGRPLRDWRLQLDKWKIGQTPDQYRAAIEEHRRRRAGLPPDESDDCVTLETGERWPKAQAVYLDHIGVWVKASGAV